MKIVGTTENNKQAISGIFHLQTSVGLPLDIIIEELKDRDMVVAWDYYVREALDGDWFGDTIYKAMTLQGLEDDYVKNVMNQVLDTYTY